MDEFNKIQMKLVDECERVHYEGLRHKGLSGSICEDLLIKALRRSVPKFSFNRGVIKYSDASIKGDALKAKDLSSQLDVIIYKGKPIFTTEGNVVVHIRDVLGVIEVKKWTHPKMLVKNSKLNKNIKNLQLILSRYSDKKIPLFFVTFRFHDRITNSNNWFNNKKDLSAQYAYCFFGAFSRDRNRNIYPWEEHRWKNFEKDPYASQFKQLVNDITALH